MSIQERQQMCDWLQVNDIVRTETFETILQAEPPLTRVQKEAIVLQACKDVMACLDQIADVYQTDLMAYSLWYREAHTEEDDYSSYITRKTCHFVVHAQIWAPKLPRVVIKFGQDAQI
jgi:hypothetical protein